MPKLEWQIATVTAIKKETPRVKTFTLELPQGRKHKAGQHYELRLRAPDGYVAQRNYSVASEPERRGEIDLTVEKVPDGEVSGYLHDVVIEGDKLELRGPIGGYFVWKPAFKDPLFLIAGGSGVVPIMSMLRHHKVSDASNPVRLLYSSRSFENIIYREELEQLAKSPDVKVHHTLTRDAPDNWTEYKRRIDEKMLSEVLAFANETPRVYVCGSTDFVEFVANTLTALAIPPERIRTERFGPTG